MLFVKRNGNKTDCIHYRRKIRPTFNSVFLSMCSGSKTSHLHSFHSSRGRNEMLTGWFMLPY